MINEARELHVRPDVPSGRWLVGTDGSPLSWHGSASEAEMAARRHAATHGAPPIYLHDRYQRVRTVPARRL